MKDKLRVAMSVTGVCLWWGNEGKGSILKT
jgi:hypothetical protein